ncbi:FHA domain-containing protein [Actinokineospora diospyrosa]|uniref:FHA domain-containing protein n=1 Tax=Actinokineospora diospyrosa TaxID=103728 RepID=A0ABT1I8X4_9PSEU|nr:FHA domain-containing protein [Actinokineospora diospyrosa]MCP2269029.1 FHA domain-containing protein [Actinokineospora diospyrosa]
MPRCPKGHESTDPAECDVCGRPIGAATPAPPAAPPPTPDPATTWDCPNGHPAQTGRFCEVCGYDSHLPAEQQRRQPPPPVETQWSISVAADRAYYDETKAHTNDLRIEFPRFVPPRRFDLVGASLVIGRADPTRGIRPDIDLTGPPEDRAIGRSHAMLVHNPPGWTIVDLHSTNHTFVNDIHTPIPPDHPTPLTPGDHIYLGAWTVLTVHAE